MPSNPLPCLPPVFRIASILTLSLLLFVALLIPAGCAVGASANLNTGAQAAQSATSTYTVSSSFFGMVVKAATVEPVIQTGSRRLWDSGVTWSALEPAPGAFTWTTLDQEVAASLQAGAAVTLTLGMTPGWASSLPALASVYGAGAAAPPANLADWDAYLAAVATRYQGRISAYEVWNAPEDPTFWAGAPAQLGVQMAALAEHAANVIHAIDPAALVVAPALSAGGLEQFLAAGGGAYVDALTVLPALNGQAPEATLAAVSAVRAVTADPSVATKPLWNSQSSWTLPPTAEDPQSQAAFAARSLILNASAGVQRLSWYAWDDHAAGSLQLTDNSGRPTAAATAYAVVEGWLSGATMNGCAADAESTWTCQIVRDGRPEWILWNPAGTIASSSLGAATMTDLNGTVQPVAAGTVTVSAAPVLLQ